MPACAKCSDPLPSDFECVLCKCCNLHFHYTCAGVRESKWRTISSEAKSYWRCHSCKTKTDQLIKETQKINLQETDTQEIGTIETKNLWKEP